MIHSKLHIFCGILYLLFGLIPSSLISQSQASSIQSFDRVKWKETTKGIDYAGELGKVKNEKAKKKRRRGEASPKAKELQPSRINFTGAGFLGKVLLFILGAVVLYFLIKAMTGLDNPRNTKIDKEAESLAKAIEKAEENIPEADTRSLLQEAIEQEAYNLAIRLYFLDTLKELTQKQIIQWKKDKTNRDYQLELSDHHLKKDFNQLVNIFNHLWYGKRYINKQDFQAIEPHFQYFIQAIHQTPKLNTNP